ncbi:efflux RND transporter periplasmic adaptor subunit [Magnetospirillum fulvum]|uniref:RND family efflux transporter, MFP subunit n=1 Tax=Magnetospirillum fulvum TaxID=1082 RepID=A0A1H6HZP8_MAGFU|nr:efflux RND transporter periplasmic adaptor subunit [Magnetospirillum fulvum]SEH41499.1 RND family efflux transporter, MFP subunit [Magnetospirillum fulvum]
MSKKILFGIAAAMLIVATGALALRALQAPAEAPRPAVLTVTATSPQRQDWPQLLSASGALVAWQEAVIGAEVGSLRVSELFVDVGSVVTKGQELARLSQDSTRAELRKQEAQVAQYKASLSQAQANAHRARVVKDSGALSEQQVTEYLITEETARATLAAAEADREATRITLAKTVVRAVDDGVITSRSATLGNVVAAGTELFRLLRQNRVEWNAELDAQQLALVRPGQKAHLILPGGTRVDGTVRMAAPSLSASTSRGIVYVALPGGSGATVGSYASGEIELEARSALTVPQSAVVLRDGRAYVFTLNEDNRVARHTVTTARRRDNRVEITEGLAADARVVESGGAFLSDGAIVTVAEARP